MKRRTLFLTFGVMSIAIFLLLYGGYALWPLTRELSLARALGQTGAAALATPMLLAFSFGALLLLLGTKDERRARHEQGVSAVFFAALFAERFAPTSIVRALSPLVDYPVLTRQYFDTAATLRVLSFYATLVGMLLVVLAWRELERRDGLVTSGVYRLARHPQHLGFVLVAIGWLLRWPTVLTILIFPFYVAIFVVQARRESVQLRQVFGSAYEHYAERIGPICPRFWRRQVRGPQAP